MIKRVLLFSIFSLILVSCASDVLESNNTDCGGEVSYDNGIKEIIDETCAYSGCHNGAGSAPGDYRSFEGMQRFIYNGSLESV